MSGSYPRIRRFQLTEKKLQKNTLKGRTVELELKFWPPAPAPGQFGRKNIVLFVQLTCPKNYVC